MTPFARLVGLALIGAIAAGLTACSTDEAAPVHSPGAASSQPSRQSQTVESPPVDPAPSAAAQDASAIAELVALTQESIPAIMKSANGAYSDVVIGHENGDTITYDYYYAGPVDPDEARAYFDDMLPTFQRTCDNEVFPSMTSAGVTSPKARYTYFNLDGTEIWTHLFAASAG